MSSENGKKRFNLRPRARIVKTFGEELISNDYVAVVELVKNSYDADAHAVNVTLEGPLDEGTGKITIQDDGIGMSPDEVETYWMEPASISKYSLRKSKSGRLYLGQKGIGRFSTAKLAKKLTLTTRKDEFPEVEANFNWEDYYDPTKYLDEISGLWETRDPTVIKKNGTILEMAELHSSWNESRVQELVIQLQRLISPVAPPKDFKINIFLPEELKKFSGEIEPSKMLSNPHYTIKAALHVDGILYLEYQSGRDKSKNETFTLNVILKSGKQPSCGPVDFEFRVWDGDLLDELAVELKNSVKNIESDLRASSGISVYRDGFRVSPYGNYRNDWLRLDLRRVQAPTFRVSNNRVVGRVSITDQDNPILKDQTNREGIVESDALHDLQEVAIIVLSELESRRYKERRPEEAEEKKPLFMQQKIDLGSIREVIEKKLPDDKEVREVLDKKETEINQRVDELRDVVIRYRRLSTLGQLVDVVLHDARNSLSRVNKGIQIIEEEVKEQLSEPSEKIQRNVSHVKQGSKLLTELFKRLEPFGGRRRERAKVIVMEDAINDVFKIYESELEEHSIQYKAPTTNTQIKISESDFKLMIINLLNNSLYWLSKVDENAREVGVSLDFKDEVITLSFTDNGPGIPADDAPYIFDPYYSKRPDGVGLGLPIVGELVTEYGGKLELVDDDNAGATFRIILPVGGK